MALWSEYDYVDYMFRALKYFMNSSGASTRALPLPLAACSASAASDVVLQGGRSKASHCRADNALRRAATDESDESEENTPELAVVC